MTLYLALLLQDPADFARRLRDIDAAFHARKSPMNEKEFAALQANVDAHLSFLGIGRPAKAMQCLTHALAVARAIDPADPSLYPASLSLRAPAVLEADVEAEIAVTVEAMYDARPPDGTRSRLVLSVGTDVIAETVDLAPLKATRAWKEGVVWAELFLDDAREPVLREAVLIVTDLKARMKAARRDIDAVKEGETYYTLKHHLSLLDQLRKGERLPTPPVFPLLLKRIEDDLAAIADKEDPYAKRTGDLWRATKSGIYEVVYRVYVPKSYDPDDKTPLVVALHPALGSEHAYFETAGGAIKALADERGWIVACPRGQLTDADPKPIFALIDGLSNAYTIDPKRIFITGHGVGASLAVRAALERPKTFRAVAAVGGFCPVRFYEDLHEFPLYLAASPFQPETDDLRAYARHLAGHPRFAFDEVELSNGHLLAPITLPAVFKWFDENRDR